MIDYRAIFEVILFLMLGIPGLILFGIAILLMSFMLWMGVSLAFTETAKWLIGLVQKRMGRARI